MDDRQAARERLLSIHRKAVRDENLIKPLPSSQVLPVEKLKTHKSSIGKKDKLDDECEQQRPRATALTKATVRTQRQRRSKLLRLHALQRRRIALAAEVAEVRFRASNACRPTLRSQLELSLPPPSNSTGDEAHATMEQQQFDRFNTDHVATTAAAASVTDVARLHAFRQELCLNAAFRLAGISLFPNDKEMLALRLDVNVRHIGASLASDDGFGPDTNTADDVVAGDVGKTFVAGSSADAAAPSSSPYCYHCFFKLVVNADKTNEYWLRMEQHTLPAAIPVAAIIHQHFGGEAVFVGTKSSDSGTIQYPSTVTQTANNPSAAAALHKVGNVARQLYRACYCWHMRKETLEYLQRLATASSSKLQNTSKLLLHQPLAQQYLSRQHPLHQPANDDHLGSFRGAHNIVDETLALATDGTESTETATPRNYTVSNVECAMALGPKASYKTIRFQLHHAMSTIASSAHVTLQYAADLGCASAILSHQPVSAKFRLSTGSSSLLSSRQKRGRSLPYNDAIDIVSDGDDEEHHHEFISTAEVSFLRLPIDKALHQVAEAMQLK